MAKITQSRWIALFLLQSFNKSEIGQKNMQKYLFNEKSNDNQNIYMITKT